MKFEFHIIFIQQEIVYFSFETIKNIKIILGSQAIQKLEEGQISLASHSLPNPAISMGHNWSFLNRRVIGAPVVVSVLYINLANFTDRYLQMGNWAKE